MRRLYSHPTSPGHRDGDRIPPCAGREIRGAQAVVAGAGCHGRGAGGSVGKRGRDRRERKVRVAHVRHGRGSGGGCSGRCACAHGARRAAGRAIAVVEGAVLPAGATDARKGRALRLAADVVARACVSLLHGGVLEWRYVCGCETDEVEGEGQ